MNMKWLFLGIGIVLGMLLLWGIQKMRAAQKMPAPGAVTTPA